MRLPQHLLAALWENLVRPSTSLSVPEQRRLARLLSILVLAMMAATVLANVSIFLSEPTYLTTTLPTTGPGLLALAAAYALSRTRYYRPAALIVLVDLSAASLAGAVINPDYQIIGPLTLTQGLLLAAFFFSARETSLIALGNWLALVLVLFALPGSRPTSETIATVFLVTLESATILVWQRFRNQTERERQAELLESAERFQHMADSVPILIWMSGTDMLCTYFNHPWLEFTGRPLEHELGDGWSEGVHPDDLARCLNDYASAFRERRPFSMEYRLRRADGEYRRVRDDGAPRVAPDGTFLGYIGGCVDVTDQRRAESAISESEQRLRLVTDNVRDMILQADEKGTIRYVSPSAQNVWGVMPDEMLGTHISKWFTRIHPDDVDRIQQVFSDRLATGEGPRVVTYRFNHTNGQYRWMENVVNPFTRDDGSLNGFVYVIRDITEREEANAHLRQADARFSMTFNASPIGISISTVDRGRYIDVNPAFLKMYGFMTRDEVIGKTSCELKTWVNIEERPAMMGNVESRLGGSFEYPFRHQSGEIRDALCSAETIDLDGQACVLAMFHDITERRRAEEQLRRQAYLLENVSDAIISADLKGQILTWNQAAESIYGWKADEAIGKDVSDFLSTSYLAADSRAAIGAQMIAEGQWHGEIKQVRKDGSLLHIQVSTSLLRDSAGTPTGTVSVNRDITERKRAETALIESEAKYRYLVDNSLQGVTIFQDGHFVFANSSMSDITGYSVDNMLAMSPDQTVNLVHPDDREWVAAKIRDRLAGHAFNPHDELRLIRADGKIRTLELLVSVITYAGKPALQVNYIDITERKQAEAASKEAKDFLQQVVDTSPSMIFVTDGQGRVEFANQYTANYYGRSVEDLISKSTEDVHTSETEAQEFVGDDQEVIRTRRRIIKEELNTAPNGEQHWFYTVKVPLLRADGTVRVLGISTDITERKRAEAALIESEAKYRYLVDNSLQGMIIFQESRFVFANAAMCSITGYSIDDILAMSPQQVVNLIYVEDQPKVTSNIRRRLSGLPVTPMNEHRFVRADGQIRTVELRAGLITYQGKLAILAHYIDVTERVQVEQELKRYHDHLEELVNQRTAELEAANEQLVRLGNAKDEFVSNVSHELRTPLTSIKLRQRLTLAHPDELEKHMGVMERETDRLRRIIEDLLQLSSLDRNQAELKRMPVNLYELISRYVSDRATVTNMRGLKVKVKGKARQPVTLADEGLLEEVLGVLLTNATNYTPPGGEITFAALHQKSQGHSRVGFSVTDTGPGIGAEDQLHLFERFFRGRTGKQSGAAGTGLGLALAREIVQRHGGRIEVHSSGVPGEGARFTVWLPERNTA